MGVVWEPEAASPVANCGALLNKDLLKSRSSKEYVIHWKCLSEAPLSKVTERISSVRTEKRSQVATLRVSNYTDQASLKSRDLPASCPLDVGLQLLSPNFSPLQCWVMESRALHRLDDPSSLTSNGPRRSVVPRHPLLQAAGNMDSSFKQRLHTKAAVLNEFPQTSRGETESLALCSFQSVLGKITKDMLGKVGMVAQVTSQ